MLAVCFGPNPEISICKNACFCLVNIASQPEGNRWLAGNHQFLYGSNSEPQSLVPNIGALNSLLRLLQLGQPDCAWFAIA